MPPSFVVLLKPGQHGAHAAGGQANACIGRAIIQVNGIAIWRNGIAARENGIPDIPGLFVRFLRAENPLIAALQAIFRSMQIKQRQS